MSPRRGLSGFSEGVLFHQILQPPILACVVMCFTQESLDAVCGGVDMYMSSSSPKYTKLRIAEAVAGDTHSPNYFSVLRESSLSGSDFPIHSGNDWREPAVPDRQVGSVFAVSPTGPLR